MIATTSTQLPGGWVVAVLVKASGEPLQRYYFAIGQEDRHRAEWTAVDCAVRLGEVATSPVGGQEPVEALRQLTRGKMAILGLKPGEVRELGWRSPRRWLS